MITLCFDEQKIKVPESWSDIRLGDYEQWFRMEPKNRLEQVAMIAGVCGIEAEVLLNNPTQVFDIICDTVKFVFEDYQGELANSIQIDGTKHSISFTDELTLSEWVDVESVFETESENRLSDILSILCRPVGEGYDSKISDSRKAIFQDLTMDKVLPLLAFFLQQREKYQAVSNLYLEVKEQVDQFLQLTQTFVESGDGIKSLPIWQRIKYMFLMRSLKKQLSKCSDFYFTDSIKVKPKKNKTSFLAA